MTTIDPKTTQVKSYRGLARLLSRSHSTVCGWCQRADWPFSPQPPWPIGDVAEMDVWADENLPPDRSHRQEKPERVPAPGLFVTGAMITSGNPLFEGLREMLGPIYSKLRMSDFDKLGVLMSAALVCVMQDHLNETDGGELQREAGTEYYRRLLERAGGATVADAWNCVTGRWLDELRKRRELRALIDEHMNAGEPAQPTKRP